MATREIKTRFRLEGESEYRRAMKESADAIKVLNSEQKLAKAQFEATGDAQQYLADTARILSEEIEEQEKAVAAAQAAIDKLRESGVEPTNATFQKWQEKLNNSQTALINLNKKLDDTQTAMKAQDPVIEGYKGKMSEAEASVQGLNDKLKETESEYQQHGDKQQYAADKAAILRDKIAEQEAAVNTAKEAIEHLTKEGVAENSKEMLAWKDKLAQAETALSSTKDELSALETGMNNSNTSIETYKTNVENSKTAVSNLDAQLKLAKTQFELNGDKQQYAADKAKILKEKLEEQQKAITDTQSVINLLTAQGLEPSAAEMVEWKTRLAEAKLELQNTQTELDNLDTDLAENKDSIDAGTDSAKDFGDELNRVGNGIDFQNTITSIDNIKGKIEGVIKAAARAAVAFWNMEADAGKWADDLATAAAKAGMDVETYQSWNYASQFIDTDVAKITSTITKLEKDLGSEDEEIAKAFNQLGVSTRQASGQVKNATVVFWDVIDALGRIEDPTRRSILAQKLLGQSWKDLNPLIDAGSKAYKDLAQEGLDTAVVSEENVKKLGDMNDAQTKLNASIQKAKFDTLAALAPTFTEVSNALNTAVGALNDFLQSEAGQEALSNLNEALSGVIESFLGEDGGKGTFASIVEGASGALETLNNALEWIQNNGGVVEGIVLGLAAAWGGLEITKSVLTFMQLLQHIPTEKLSSIFGGGAAASSSGAADAGTSAVSNAVKSASTAGMSAAADALLGIGTAAGVTLIALTPAILAEKHLREQTTKTLEGVRESATKAAEAIGKDAEAAVATVNAAVTALGISKEHFDVFGQGVLADVKEVNEALREAASNTPEQYLSGKTRLLLNRQQEQGLSGMQEDELLYKIMEEAADSLINPKTQQATDDLAGTISDALDDILAIQEALDETKTPENIEALYSLIDQIVGNKDLLDSLSESTKDLLGAYYDEESGYGAGSANQFSDAQELLKTLMEDLESAYDRAREEGNNVSGGIADGIQEGQSAIEGAANDAAGGAATGAEARLADGSMETIGYNASIGLANGIADGQDAVIAAAEAVAQAAADTMASALQIQSPSKVMARLGGFTAQGFAEGIDSGMSDVERAVSRMAGAAFRVPVMAAPQMPRIVQAAPGVPGAQAADAGATGQNIQAVIMMDKRAVGYMVAPAVNEAIGAIVEEMRA